MDFAEQWLNLLAAIIEQAHKDARLAEPDEREQLQQEASDFLQAMQQQATDLSPVYRIPLRRRGGRLHWDFAETVDARRQRWRRQPTER